MNGAHFTGGALGALAGAILAPLLARWGVSVTDTTASLVGAVAVSAGAGLGHLVASQGIWPALKRAFVGPPKPSPVVIVEPPPRPPAEPPAA